MRVLHQPVALARFFAVGQQRHARVSDPQAALGVQAAHLRELKEVFRLAVGGCANVEQQKHPFTRRKLDRQRRALDAAHPPEDERGRRHSRAAVPGRHKRVGLAIAHHAQPDGVRRARLAAHRLGGVLVHRNHFRRIDDREVQAGGRPFAQLGTNSRLGAKQHNLAAQLARGAHRSRHRLGRRVVAARRIKHDPHSVSLLLKFTDHSEIT